MRILLLAALLALTACGEMRLAHQCSMNEYLTNPNCK